MTELVTQFSRQGQRGVLRFKRRIGRFHLLKSLQTGFPTSFQFRRDQSVFGVDELVLALSTVRLVSHLLHPVLPIMAQLKILLVVLGNHGLQSIQLSGLKGFEEGLHDHWVDEVGVEKVAVHLTELPSERLTNIASRWFVNGDIRCPQLPQKTRPCKSAFPSRGVFAPVASGVNWTGRFACNRC